MLNEKVERKHFFLRSCCLGFFSLPVFSSLWSKLTFSPWKMNVWKAWSVLEVTKGPHLNYFPKTFHIFSEIFPRFSLSIFGANLFFFFFHPLKHSYHQQPLYHFIHSLWLHSTPVDTFFEGLWVQIVRVVVFTIHFLTLHFGFSRFLIIIWNKFTRRWKKIINEKNLNFPRILLLNEQNDPKP